MSEAAEANAGTMIPGESAAPINFDVEARKVGWTPLDEFKGDPSKHIDAETFYNRAQEYMPIAKATIRKLTDRIDRMERDAKKSAEFFGKAEERAYQRAIDDIRREQEAAVEAGDLDAHRAASKKLDALEKPNAPEKVDNEQRAEEFADWGKANKWYSTDPVMQAYANAQAEILAKRKGGGFLDRADLDAVTEKVREKFPEEFEDTAAPRQKRPAVDSGGNRRSTTGGKGYADLPSEARAMCDRWVKNGVIKSKDDFVKNFDFDGYQKAAR